MSTAPKILLVLLLSGVSLALQPEESSESEAGGFVEQREIVASHMNNSLKVINGYDAAPGEFPSYVALSMSHPSTQACGGTILSPRIILTAAHCVTYENTGLPLDVRELSVKPTWYRPVSSEDAKWIPVSRICMSGAYDHDNSTYDYAILRLEKDILFSKFVHSARLPKVELPLGVTAYAVGLGADNYVSITENTKPNQLQALPTQRVRCDQSHDIHESKLCIQSPGASTCRGDSGGPLLVGKGKKQIVYGVVSYGEQGCPVGKRNVFADVFSMRQSIHKLMRQCSW